MSEDSNLGAGTGINEICQLNAKNWIKSTNIAVTVIRILFRMLDKVFKH